MQLGDYVLFYAAGYFYYSSKVLYKKFSPELAKLLWPNDENGVGWPCIFFVEDLKKIKISIKTVQKLAGYEQTWDRVQGFMRLRDEGLDAIVQQFGTIDAFLGQQPSVYEIIENIISKEKESEIIEEVDSTLTEDELLKLGREYVIPDQAFVFKNGPHKVRVESKKQKHIVATIEKYACQVCGWTLKWKNSKGKEVFRIDVDHIIDKAKGGGEELSNLWVLCPNCHTKKTLGIIKIDPKKKKITEDGIEISLKHDKHLNWWSK